MFTAKASYFIALQNGNNMIVSGNLFISEVLKFHVQVRNNEDIRNANEMF